MRQTTIKMPRFPWTLFLIFLQVPFISKAVIPQTNNNMIQHSNIQHFTSLYNLLCDSYIRFRRLNITRRV